MLLVIPGLLLVPLWVLIRVAWIVAGVARNSLRCGGVTVSGQHCSMSV